VARDNETRMFGDEASRNGAVGAAADAETDAAMSWFPWEHGSGEPEPAVPGYPERSAYPSDPQYPRGVGYAPFLPEQPGPGEQGDAGSSGYRGYRGYPAGPGHDYAQNGWNGTDPVDPVGSGPDQDYVYPGYPLRDFAYPPGSSYPPEPGYEYGEDAVTPTPTEHVAGSEAGAPGLTGRVPPPFLTPRIAASPGIADLAGAAQITDSLTAESLLNGKRSGLGSGWRHRLHQVTGGLLRLGESAADMRRRDLINRVRTPVAVGHHRVAVLSLKGGVGKTTTAVGLGATLATLRGDRVIAVDANPDRGTLSDKVRLETAATIRDLLNERDQIRRYADMRAFTTQAPSRLEVLASDRDPAVSVAFSADDYCDVAGVLENFYSICLTDCGTGLLHSAMYGVLRLADQIVVVSSPSVDGARSASATIDWLDAHNCGDLVRNGVVVLSTIRPKSKSTVDLDRLERHFAARCRAVARIPYDPHLEEGAEVELELLSAETADAYLTLAALVGDGLAWPRPLTSRSALP
jgi:MinD-like ATPase involved in chromosome partitioning or flagellar assembly